MDMVENKFIKTQVAIVGAGPAGLLLSQLLYLQGIDSIVIETRSRERVESRIRAGQLEPGAVKVLTDAGIGVRMHQEGIASTGVSFHYEGLTRRLDLASLAGEGVMMYGQREVVRDLIKLRLSLDGTIFFDATPVALHRIETNSPSLTFQHGGEQYQINCEFIAGCDGYHGVCRQAIGHALKIYEVAHHFGWVGVLADIPPIAEEVVYACHERGLALFSMRSRSLSRMYLQCAHDEDLEEWSDDHIWSELALRLGGQVDLKRGPILEKSIVRMRSFIVEPMQHGRVFLAGDAAHIVPPSAAKGLNLAIGDIQLLSRGFEAYFRSCNQQPLQNYSREALMNVWEGQRFSQWMTRLLHRSQSGSALDRRLQLAELENMFRSPAAAKSFAEAYVGSNRTLPGR